ncbi:MAG: hypothetical protein HY341_01745 [Candidatus Kerfeldbacteria bacterium]|nr:hypothetical protein [Candidatus Kerfeldbacteria bacterium]
MLHLVGFYRKHSYVLLWASNRRVFRTIRHSDVLSVNHHDPLFFVRWVSTGAGRRLVLVSITVEENRLPVHLKAITVDRRKPSLVLEEAQEYHWAESVEEAREKGLCVPYER